jgi:endonuclease/exonuclease/phosphatase family metal-dependent hydrolase
MRLLLFLLGTAFVTSAAAADPPIAADEARPLVSWNDAGRVVGSVAFVSGRVAGIRQPRGMTLIDFFDEKPAAFTGVIRQADYGKFPAKPADLYRDKILRIRGLVTTYRGVPQIAITSPNQVEILDALPETQQPAKTLPTAAADRIRFAEYNVLNLFDADDDPYHADEATPTKPRAELEALANSIRSLNADVIALEEVENRGYLERFLEVFLKDMGYQDVVLFEGNDRRGIDVALVSRIPIGPVESNRHCTFPGPDGKPIHFARDVIEVTVEPTNAPSFEVWVVHLQSNSQGREYAEPIRLAEARQIRRMLDEDFQRDTKARIVLTGDFNDTWDSETMKTIVGEGSTSMWSAASDHEGELPDTYNQGRYHSMIDFVLCSPAMAKQYVPRSFHVVPGSPESSGSDHNPVAVEFSLQTAP